ncbi:MAG: phosphate ABC transporter permease PstA [Oscillospiraceae bacterium]|jgi:phosphate transport system permease protein|nr:phosphate ABC transporter permease PstA [Oscillospiraceae bacterium]
MRVNPRTAQKFAKGLIWAVALLVIAVLLFIIVFILYRGLSVINWSFLTEVPRRSGRAGGIASPIVGTLSVTLLAVLVAMPFGVGTAFYLAEYTRGGIITRIIRFCTESLAGIPSIIYGLFGFIFFVDVLGLDWSILSGGLTVAIMILPTLIRTSEEAIRSVPVTYREVSYSLGGTKWQTIRRAVVPSAIRGIANGLILSVGRCVAETAALIMTAGVELAMPRSVMDSSKTMAVHFYTLVMEGLSTRNAYGTAAVLIILVFLINVVANMLINRFVAKGR